MHPNTSNSFSLCSMPPSSRKKIIAASHQDGTKGRRERQSFLVEAWIGSGGRERSGSYVKFKSDAGMVVDTDGLDDSDSLNEANCCLTTAVSTVFPI